MEGKRGRKERVERKMALSQDCCENCWYFSDKDTRICCCESSDYHDRRVWADMVCPSFSALEPGWEEDDIAKELGVEKKHDEG